MPKWTDYTIKTEPADNDEVMVLDTAGKANKRLGLSALSDWIIGKIANKVFENLQTQNKTILGALNELNSKTIKQIFTNEGLNDFEWARKYWENITDIDSIKIVYNSYHNEYTYIFSKRAGKNGTVIRWGYSNPQIEMIRFTNGNCTDTFFKIIS